MIAAYRSPSEAEASFRQLKDPHVVSFSPMFHWTEHNIRGHSFTCVLALQIAHLIRLQTGRAGLHLSVRQLLHQLDGIAETVLIYPPPAAGPKPVACSPKPPACKTNSPPIFGLDRWAPAVRS